MSLKKVQIVEAVDGLQPQFMKLPTRLKYQREGEDARFWEMSNGHDTVHVLVNKVDSGEILLVKQIRPPVLHKHPDTQGIVFEACAGLIDKYEEYAQVPIRRARMVASEEVHEEVGYKVRFQDLVGLPTYMSNVGMSGGTCYPFYCEVTDADFIGQKLEPSEDIEVFHLKYNLVKAFLEQTTNTDATTRNLLQWFLISKG